MTDMRATERLLGVIESNADRIISNPDNYWTLAREMEMAARELRRRGDTLVRRDDLRMVVEEAIQDRFCVEQNFSVTGGRAEEEHDQESGYTAALNRLEIALGGKQ